ncbi:hypothetical protein GmHk_16G046101 [Glycine max]|nr:hypothetical protein GmHk_16G046101 [Glycine max]
MSHSNSIFHTALTVSNIKNHVPIILEMENVPYVTWAELFKPRNHISITLEMENVCRRAASSFNLFRVSQVHIEVTVIINLRFIRLGRCSHLRKPTMVDASQSIYDSNFSHSDQQQRGKPSGYHKNSRKKKIVAVVLGPIRDSLSVRVRRSVLLA